MKIYKFFYLNKDKEENNYYKLLYPKEYKDEDKEKIDEIAYPNENNEEEEKIDSLVSSNESKEEEYEEEDICFEDFVEKNKYKYKIIYTNKIYPL